MSASAAVSQATSYITLSGSCPSGSVHNAEGTTCYWLHGSTSTAAQKQTQEGATQLCKTQAGNTNATLVMIKDEETQTLTKGLLKHRE